MTRTSSAGRIIAAIVVVAVVSGCKREPPRPTVEVVSYKPRPVVVPDGARLRENAETVTPEMLQSERFNICELVVRDMLLDSAAPTNFISYLGKDPSDEHLGRFVTQGYVVRRGSQFIPGGGMRLFAVEAIDVEDAVDVVVRCGNAAHGLDGALMSYTLRRIDGKWVIVRRLCTSISCIGGTRETRC